MFKKRYLAILVLIISKISFACDLTCEQILKEKIIEQFKINNIFASIDNYDDVELIIKNNKLDENIDANNIKFELTDVELKTNRFKGKITLNKEKNNNSLTTILNLQGNFYQLIEIVSVNKKMKKGSIVTYDDIEKIKIHLNKLSSDIIISEEDLVGKEIVISLNQHKPIHKKYVKEPIAIHKKQLVSVIYQSKSIYLKTEAIALENGAMGDIIKVKNTKNNAVLSAIVKNNQEVLIKAFQ